MAAIPGMVLRRLLIGAGVWRDHHCGEPITVLDIIAAEDPADDIAITLAWEGGDDDVVRAVLVRTLLAPPARIDIPDAAWADYRARQFKARLVVVND